MRRACVRAWACLCVCVGMCVFVRACASERARAHRLIKERVRRDDASLPLLCDEKLRES